MGQWLGFLASTARDRASIPDWEAKISHALWSGQKTQTKTNKTSPRISPELWCGTLAKLLNHGTVCLSQVTILDCAQIYHL